MAFKVFLDANVLLDFLLKRDNYEDARDIMSLVIEGKVNAYITPAIVHIVGYWLAKAHGSEKAKQLYSACLITFGQLILAMN